MPAVQSVMVARPVRGVDRHAEEAWLLHQPGVTAPIIGASKPHHLDDALAALALKLEPPELTALDEPYRPHPVLGHR